MSAGEFYRPAWSALSNQDDDDDDDEDEETESVLVSALPHAFSPPWQDLIVSDATPTGLATAMQWNDQRVGVISDEGYPIQQLIKAVDHGGLDLYLKGWSGDSVSIRRRGGRMSFSSPEVVLGLLVQPEVASSMFTSKALVGRGIPQRALWSIASSSGGSRSYADSSSCPIHLQAAWHDRVGALLALPRFSGLRKRELRLDPEAATAYARLADRLDRERQNPRHSSFVQQWHGKAHGQALRIAGLLTILGKPDEPSIGASAIAAAEAWISFFSAHAEAASISMGSVDSTYFHARRVVAWIGEQQLPAISRNTIVQALRCHDLPKVSDWAAVFDMLVSHGFLRPTKSAIGVFGGRPSVGFEVNPAVLSVEQASVAVKPIG